MGEAACHGDSSKLNSPSSNCRSCWAKQAASGLSAQGLPGFLSNDCAQSKETPLTNTAGDKCS
eukprot:11737080-Prorocentrum_lima.AAC.1